MAELSLKTVSKTKMRYQYTSVRMAKVKNNNVTTLNVCEDEKKLAFWYIVSGAVKWNSLSGK